MRFSVSLYCKASGDISIWKGKKYGHVSLSKDYQGITSGVKGFFSEIHTWPKVHGGIDILYCSTFEVAYAAAVCGEQHHIISKVGPEQFGQVSQIVVITSKVTAVFILYLSF